MRHALSYNFARLRSGVRKLRVCRDIADRINSRNRSFVVIAGHNKSTLGLHAKLVEPKSFGVDRTPHRDKRCIDFHVEWRTVIVDQVHDHTVALHFSAIGFGACVDDDSASAELFLHDFRSFFIFQRKNPGQKLSNRHLHPKRVHHIRKFHSDRAGT